MHRDVSGHFVASITGIPCSLSVVQDVVLGQGHALAHLAHAKRVCECGHTF